MVYIRVLKTVYTIFLSNETFDLSISCICMFLLASEWALPPHFRAFSWFGPNIFRAEKKSIEDIVYIRLLRIAYTILFSNETLDLSISCLLKFLLASEWALPPHFRAFSFFGPNIFQAKQKKYWRCCLYTASTNFLYYSSFKWNRWCVHIMSLSDFTNTWISLSPHFRAFSWRVGALGS